MIEAGEGTRDVVRSEVRGGLGHGQAELLGDADQRGGQGHGVESDRALRSAAKRVRDVVAVPPRDREHVGEEQEVELAALERSGDVRVVVELEKVAPGLGMTPARVAVGDGAGDLEAGEVKGS